MTSEILCNPNMGDPLIAAAPMRRSTESSSFSLYTCRVCFRAFSTTRALGGHQTAHRKEKSVRLNRLIRQAEIDMLKYAADNDVVLSPEPISWLPPEIDDQTFKFYNFMPGSDSQNKAYDVDKKQKKRKFMDLSGCSEVNNEASDGDQKQQKKRKYSTKLSECSENKVADADKAENKKRKSTNLSDCSENNASELEQKKQKKQKSTKSSECSEHKASNTGKKKLKFMNLLSECSDINTGSDADNKKRKPKKLSECSFNKDKIQFTKLMPNPELTLATGTAPDVLVQVFSTDSNESGRIEYF